MATLADSFLDDLDELGESSDEETQEEGGEKSAPGRGEGDGAEGDDDGMEVRARGRTEGRRQTWLVAFTNMVAFIRQYNITHRLTLCG